MKSSASELGLSLCNKISNFQSASDGINIQDIVLVWKSNRNKMEAKSLAIIYVVI